MKMIDNSKEEGGADGRNEGETIPKMRRRRR